MNESDVVNQQGLGSADDEDELNYDLDYSPETRVMPGDDPLDVNGDGDVSASEAVAGITNSDTPDSDQMITDGGDEAEADLIQRRNSLL